MCWKIYYIHPQSVRTLLSDDCAAAKFSRQAYTGQDETTENNGYVVVPDTETLTMRKAEVLPNAAQQLKKCVHHRH